MKNNPDPKDVMEQCLQILLKKHKDYGPLNIAHAPGGAMNGLTVRMYDKLARISHLCSNKNDTPNYESIEDSLIDLVNYATIGILVQRGLWEGIPLRSTYEEDSSSI
jgi:hypothetical protein